MSPSTASPKSALLGAEALAAAIELQPPQLRDLERELVELRVAPGDLAAAARHNARVSSRNWAASSS